MAEIPDFNVGGQLKVGTGIFPAIGEGPIKVNGSAGIEGPVVMGAPLQFPTTTVSYTHLTLPTICSV